MTLTASPADALAPLRLPPDLRLTPEQFELVCAENRDAVLELAADGRVIAMTPTGSETGLRNGELVSSSSCTPNPREDGRLSTAPRAFGCPMGRS